MSISEVIVKGTYKKADGKPETGIVKFRPALWQQSGGIDAVLDSSGSFQTKFPASDSGNWPDGLQIPYRVTVAVSSGTYVKELTLKSADSPIDLPTLFPIVSADSGGSGGGGGGVPAAHAASHQPGGSDELPALLTLGNRLTWAEWTAAPGSFTPANATVSYGGQSVVLTGTSTSIGGGWAGGAGAAGGRVPVTPGTSVTASALASIDDAAAARDARMRLYFWPGAALSQGTTIVVPLSGGLVELRHTAVAPAGATAVSCFVNIAPVVVGERFRLAKPALWIGAGGEARPPGEIIPGLGGGGGDALPKVTRPNGTDLLVQHLINGVWTTVSYDSGWRDISALLEPGWTGTVMVRRDATDLVVHVSPLAFTAEATSDVFWRPPSGWGVPTGVITGNESRFGSIPDGGACTRWATIVLSNLGLVCKRNVGNTAPNVNFWGSTRGPVTRTIPTILPGIGKETVPGSIKLG